MPPSGGSQDDYQGLEIPPVGQGLVGAAAVAIVTAGPVEAADKVHTCLQNSAGQDTATFVFHPTLFGVDGDEGDGDVFSDDFEHQFGYWIKVEGYDPKRPDWTGPVACDIRGKWGKDWDMPNIRYEFMTQTPDGIVYIKDVPRYSKLSLQFWIQEMDSAGHDAVDLDPSPDGCSNQLFL